MRRGLLLAGIWLLGAGLAVTFSFAAVGRVASGVTPTDGAALSRRDIDSALIAGAAGQPRGSSAAPTTTASSTLKPPATTVPHSPSSVVAPTTPTVAPFVISDTVTTSQGGTVWTRCSGPNSIVYVAAIPKNGYRRSVDVEASTGIIQQFENGSSRSKVRAACSNGVVHAEVEEGSADN